MTAGLFALSERSNPWFALLAAVPISMFWGLDVYYLRTEYRYRDLYKQLCCHLTDGEYAFAMNYSLDLTDYKGIPVAPIREILFSKTQLWFYAPLLLSVGAVVAALNFFAGKVK